MAARSNPTSTAAKAAKRLSGGQAARVEYKAIKTSSNRYNAKAMHKTRKHFVPRLYVEALLEKAAEIKLNAAQSHYVLNVMRLGKGDNLLLFNGTHGEWHGNILTTGREVKIELEQKTRSQVYPIDLVVLFSLLRGQRSAFIAQKAAELGVKKLQPLIMARTIARSVNVEKLRANAIEGAEQSESLFVPLIEPPAELEQALQKIEKDRALIFCDETLKQGAPLEQLMSHDKSLRGNMSHDESLRGHKKFAILIGPEGGFTPEERQAVSALPLVRPLRLGTQILRAETALIAAVVLFQTILGDWQNDANR